MDKLLDRESFHRDVLARSQGKCIFCDMPAVNAHHILERKLYLDGGYYLSNGAAVCEAHHWQCETTEFSVEDVRAAAGIDRPALPAGFEPGELYDKWGNRIRPDGLREPGPLFDDAGARKALAKGGKLGLFVPKGTPLC